MSSICLYWQRRHAQGRAPLIDRFDGKRNFDVLTVRIIRAAGRTKRVISSRRLQPQLFLIVCLAFGGGVSGLFGQHARVGHRVRVARRSDIRAAVDGRCCVRGGRCDPGKISSSGRVDHGGRHGLDRLPDLRVVFCAGSGAHANRRRGRHACACSARFAMAATAHRDERSGPAHTARPRSSMRATSA